MYQWACMMAQECVKLVGLYMLKETKKILTSTHLDSPDTTDQLTWRMYVKGHNADKLKILKNPGLNITVDTNLKKENYLDVTLNLDEKLYKPYKKPNDEPQYINKLSNHPPPITRNIPTSIGKRISCISSNKNINFSMKHPKSIMMH